MIVVNIMDMACFAMRRRISLFFAALCASLSAFVYEAGVNPGHDPTSPWYVAGIAGFAAGAWAWAVFPRMGRHWLKDILWIAGAFPCVGAMTGALLSFGHPLGIIGGLRVALDLPFLFPEVIAPLYLFGAGLAFLLPRIPRFR
ncbi:hypothetical protein C1J03_18500 [Sulfitobacter sp. SK012]|uniref:hypothetical protein n=1 Tax=Sulfitobacter sp. SK012 TaxID=1389005 RepID=UPI000E0BD67B|nr:hypothetical protein [Sulfitobacter sp. SK012]AXI47824.1 hypothetical protein C1J03_18500 [Sulfitobacter sp. SK012]